MHTEVGLPGWGPRQRDAATPRRDGVPVLRHEHLERSGRRPAHQVDDIGWRDASPESPCRWRRLLSGIYFLSPAAATILTAATSAAPLLSTYAILLRNRLPLAAPAT